MFETIESFKAINSKSIIAVLPDLQNYTGSGGRHFSVLTETIQWLLSSAKTLNIELVLQVGDLSDANKPDEWERAREAFSILDGHLPYVLTVGNHDLGIGKIGGSRDTYFNDYFKIEQNSLNEAAQLGAWQPGKLENSAARHCLAGEDWLILALEFGPRAEVLMWAENILSQYSHLPTIIVTHEFIDQLSLLQHGEALRSGTETYNSPYCYPLAHLPGGVACGEEIWERLVLPHAQVRTVVNGHYRPFGYDDFTRKIIPIDGLAEAHRSDSRPDGSCVDQYLFNAQWEIRGGNGWMLFLEMYPDRELIARKFSPLAIQSVDIV